jgi:hypothetical protein
VGWGQQFHGYLLSGLELEMGKKMLKIGTVGLPL